MYGVARLAEGAEHPVCNRRRVGLVMLEPLRQPVLFAHRSPFLDSAHHLYDESNLADVTWLTLPKNGPVPQGPDSSELAEHSAYPGRNAQLFHKWQYVLSSATSVVYSHVTRIGCIPL